MYTIIRTILHYRIRRRRHQLFRYYGIPGPEPRILDGNYGQYRQHKVFHKLDDVHRAKYGKTFGTFIGDDPLLMTTDLEILRQVFFENPDSFKDRMVLPVKGPMTKSILFAPHNRWKLFRKVMSPFFSGYKMRGSQSVQFLEETVKLTLDYIEDKFLSQRSDTIELDILDLMKSTALHTVSKMAINLPDVQVKENEPNVKSLDEFMKKVSPDLLHLIIKFPMLTGVFEFAINHFELDKALALINRGLNSEIDEKLGQLESDSKSGDLCPNQEGNLIDLLVRLHHKSKLTREEAIDNCLAILVAGYDTTSTTLTYIFWALAKHLDVQEKLRADLMTYGSESQYLDQVIDETMRLYPTLILFTSRMAAKTAEINGVTIPQGTKVNYNAWLVQRDAEIWPEPTKFDPDRFKPENEIHPCAFAPFGMGTHKCLGFQLAKLELKMIVCDIILRYEIGLISPREMDLINYGNFLSKPHERVLIELTKL